jgi:hypothetical protein
MTPPTTGSTTRWKRYTVNTHEVVKTDPDWDPAITCTCGERCVNWMNFYTHRGDAYKAEMEKIRLVLAKAVEDGSVLYHGLEELTTYKRADGEPIGDFSWVSDIEYFEDLDEPVEVIKQVWGLRTEQQFWVGNDCLICGHPVEDFDPEKAVVHPGECEKEWNGDD